MNSSRSREKQFSSEQIVCFHDGDCPICRLEVDVMKKLDKTGKVHWVDITKNQDELTIYGLSYSDAMQSMHVFDSTDKKLVSDVDGFLLLWKHLPYYRSLAKIVEWSPLIKKGLARAYSCFAKYRLKMRKA